MIDFTERARKIMDTVWGIDDWSDRELKVMAAELQTVLEEAQTKDDGLTVWVTQTSLKKAITEAYADAVRIAEELRNEKRKCSIKNEQHDNRWCPECEAMEDAYGVIEDRIRARTEEHDNVR